MIAHNGRRVKMTLHILVFAFFGVAAIAAAVYGVRWIIYRSRRAHYDEVMSVAQQRLKEGGILLRMNGEPEQIAALQRELKAHWGYKGAIDGYPGDATIAAASLYAETLGVDLEEAALSLFPIPRYVEVLPEPVKQKIAMQRAQETLQSVPLTVGHPAH